MVVDAPLKRRKLTSIDSMEAETAKAKFAAIQEKLGREIRVFETSALSPSSNEVSNSDKYSKTRKLQEAEEAAQRSKITKAVIRIRFPDNHTLEVTFHPSETIQSLIDLLTKVVARPELPFYIFTTPPKKPIKDMAQDFFSAGFVPRAIVYFSYDLPKGDVDDTTDANSGPFLQEEIMSLKGLELIIEQGQQAEPAQSAPEPVTSAPEPVTSAPSPMVQDRKPAEKKPVKPKWLKM
ncbi:plant UBX domain-containing protein 1 isoform X2 [Quercus suber]|uniref:plant UBX domain-containing protein 1 isoform X2 n=1 Tax=Quercus suber TaxID=58331 RepID=UPI0032DE8AE6